MDTFEVIINQDTYKITRSGTDSFTFSVFNYSTCHIIKQNDFGIWKEVEHRFGAAGIPIDEIGEAIERHYRQGDESVFQENMIFKRQQSL